jgi:hypothetical protein
MNIKFIGSKFPILDMVEKQFSEKKVIIGEAVIFHSWC